MSLAHVLSAPLIRFPVRTVVAPWSSDPMTFDLRLFTTESPTQTPHDRCAAKAPACAALDEEGWAAFAVGWALSLEGAIEQALAEPC